MDQITLQTSLRTVLLDIPSISQVYGQWAAHSGVTAVYPYIGMQMAIVSDDLDTQTQQMYDLKIHVWGLTPDQVININTQVYDTLHRNECSINNISRMVHINTSEIIPESNNTLFHSVLTFNINTRI